MLFEINALEAEYARTMATETAPTPQPPILSETVPGRPTAYIAGPMRGYPSFNFPAFHEAALHIRKVLGWDVISPAEMDLDLGFNPNTQRFGLNDFYLAMRRDLAMILEPRVDRIVFLPKWEASRGANVERTIGEAIGLEMWYFIPGDPNVVTMLPPGL